MRVKIIYDNEARTGFLSGWGFSCVIELENSRILFDAGWDGSLLHHNMEKLGVRLDDIDAVVISHSHWDHAGGLPSVLREGMPVYVPASFSSELKGEIGSRANLIEIKQAQEIMPGVFTSGGLKGVIEEQSLFIRTEKGLVVITGCAHPGLENILEVARTFGNVHAIMGGFHGFDKYDALEGIDLICPCHCTKHADEIARLYPEAFVRGYSGLVIDFD